MTSNEPSFGKQTARILSFRRGAKEVPHAQPNGLPSSGPGQEPVQDLAKYERGRNERDDTPGAYRHRMFVNASAFLFVIILIVAGLGLADIMARMRKNQDCVLAGRRGCTPVNVMPKERW